MTIWYGGDYNPEQWPREVWDEDVTLMQSAGVNLATVGVFRGRARAARRGVRLRVARRRARPPARGGVPVDLATATASPPPWLAARPRNAAVDPTVCG